MQKVASARWFALLTLVFFVGMVALGAFAMHLGMENGYCLAGQTANLCPSEDLLASANFHSGAYTKLLSASFGASAATLTIMILAVWYLRDRLRLDLQTLAARGRFMLARYRLRRTSLLNLFVFGMANDRRLQLAWAALHNESPSLS